MSTKQLWKRVERIEEQIRPEHDGTFTWVGFALLYKLWRKDRQQFLELAKREDGAAYRAFLAMADRLHEA